MITLTSLLSTAFLAGTVLCGACLLFVGTHIVHLLRETAEPTIGLHRANPRFRFFYVFGLFLGIMVLLMVSGYSYAMHSVSAASLDQKRIAIFLHSLTLIPLPIVTVELFNTQFWPHLGLTKHYRETVQNRSTLAKKIMESLRSTGSKDPGGGWRIGVAAVAAYVVLWLLVYVASVVNGDQVRCNLRRVEKRFEKKSHRYQMFVDVLMLVTIYAVFVFIILAVLTLLLSRPLDVYLLSLHVGVFCVLFLGGIFLLYYASSRLDIEEGVGATGYIPKELAAHTRRHRESLRSMEIPVRSKEKCDAYSVAKYRRRLSFLFFQWVSASTLLLLTLSGSLIEASGLRGALTLDVLYCARMLFEFAAVLTLTLFVISVFLCYQKETYELWEQVGLSLGARMPIHFVRQAAHRLTNGQETLSYSLREIDRRLVTAREESIPSLGKEDVSFMANRVADARESLEDMQAWVGSLHNRARDLRTTQDRWLSPDYDTWHPLTAVLRRLVRDSCAVRHRLPVSEDTKAQLSWFLIRGGEPNSVKSVKKPEDIEGYFVLFEGIDVRVDMNTFVDIFGNLLRNAVDAIKRRSHAFPPVIECTMEVSAGTMSPVLLKVYDNGTGVENKDREKLFDPYWSTKGHDGSGLGLYVAREYLRAIGGRITYTTSQSAKPPFTEFAISLPFYRMRSKDEPPVELQSS